MALAAAPLLTSACLHRFRATDSRPPPRLYVVSPAGGEDWAHSLSRLYCQADLYPYQLHFGYLRLRPESQICLDPTCRPCQG
ncbi:hypothetical protein PR003_g3592 [Phytophthora rubi]|uniref:Uncharacterized protein n=1 Tax=Phytophthora rubi TaxID=129364 RepID=A0A6A3NFB1_9STRA|nr:hypothetical protein PR002_g3576 [Phytophthora rubi]KAE9047544.1 hypothetical protein PR001_g4170 [Phytophthora rubi]KAE9353999.1 hypothetical protein PR003_g3592 [Phytophthora rubi]